MNYLNGIADCIKVIENRANALYNQAQAAQGKEKEELLHDYLVLGMAKDRLASLYENSEQEVLSSPWKRITSVEELPPFGKRVLVRDTDKDAIDTDTYIGRLERAELTKTGLYAYFSVKHYVTDEVEGFSLEWCEIPK